MGPKAAQINAEIMNHRGEELQGSHLSPTKVTTKPKAKVTTKPKVISKAKSKVTTKQKAKVTAKPKAKVISKAKSTVKKPSTRRKNTKK
jgi:uncharacterized protein (AIM24 family)